MLCLIITILKLYKICLETEGGRTNWVIQKNRNVTHKGTIFRDAIPLSSLLRHHVHQSHTM